MKDKILHAIKSKVRIQKTRSLAGTIVNVLEGEEMAAEELTALMCYREVVGMFTAFKEVHSSLNYETVIAFIIRKLRPVYPEEIILAAIEQVKNEQP